MTTIIVKDADFSGGPIRYFEPPIADATVCSFVGDATVGLKNYGTLGDLTQVGSPVQVDGLFKRFLNGTNYLVTPAYRTLNTSIMVVYRGVGVPASNYAVVVSSERDHADGGRRGISLVRNLSSYGLITSTFGTLNGASQSVAITMTQADHAANFAFGKWYPNGPSSSSFIERLTAVAANATTVSVGNATQLPAADEATAGLLRVGSSYRSFGVEACDIAFIMVVPRLISNAERDKVYASLKTRFAHFGVTL
jgi:hypothetical protein